MRLLEACIAAYGGLDRWRRRLKGLEQDYLVRLREVESDDPQSSRARALRRDTEQLAALQAFALPVLEAMAAWPERQVWGEWLRALGELVPRVLTRPPRVLRVLQELAPLASVGPVTLREVRDVLAPRLSTLTHEPHSLGPAAHVWTRTSLGPDDVDVALLYDGYSFNALSWLEGLGFCKVG